MEAQGPYGIGSSWASFVRTAFLSVRRAVLPDPAVSPGTLNSRPASAVNVVIGAAREPLRAAWGALRTAFGAFTSKSQPVYTTSLYNGASTAATLSGLSARVEPLAGGYSVLETTLSINTQTSTTRSSSTTLGLDVVSAVSRLDSSALGLDVTSAEAASTLKSSAALGLDVTSAQSASTIGSTAEMNTATTSLSAYELAFSGTSRGELSGSYSGSATSLTFKITAPASISALESVLSFTVVDQNDAQVASFTGTVAAGQVIDVGSTGLKVRFTAGTLVDQATTNVSQTATDISTTALFNASWGSAPRFENFQQVTAGSFTVNGTTIAVNANDSIDSVISRINSSGAGVTASVSGDRVTLATSGYSEDDIVVAGDTSGFLAATKLSGANATRGNVRDDQQVLSKTTQFSSVTSGSFTINGVSISVDRDTDTLASIVSRIKGAGAGVTASYDSAQDKLVLTSTSNSEDLITVAGDTTGFLAAASLSTGNTVCGNIRDDQQVLSKTTQFSSVTTGSFTINGVSISINKDTDTLTSIISRINGAGAGVTTSFNASTNRIELASAAASEDLITVSSDTTGFLAATGLSTGNTVRGNVADDQQVLSATSQFAGVVNGSFQVNGVSISVDRSQDTLQSVIGRINGAGAGVTASYNASTDKLVFTPNVAGATLTLEGDTSGLLAAAHVATGAAGTHVNANGAFNATGANGPLFDPGVTVQAATFTVNGVSIAVAANDTVNTVLTRITASGAGVTATYDDATQTVRLTSKGVTQNPIAVGNDTSGFLAAVKLNGTALSTTVTQSSPFDIAIDDLAEYSGVQAGIVTVNGQQIAIDPATTTVRGLVSALNGLSEVSATLDEATGAITVASLPGGVITISDTSGVLSTVGLSAGTYQGAGGGMIALQTHVGTAPVSNTSEVAASVSDAVERLNNALAQLGAGRDDSRQFRGTLQTALQGAIDALRSAGVQGLSVSGDGAALRVAVDRDTLATALKGLVGQADVGATIAGLVDGFTDRMTAIAATRPPEPPPRPVFLLQPPSKAETQRPAAAAIAGKKNVVAPSSPLRDAGATSRSDRPKVVGATQTLPLPQRRDQTRVKPAATQSASPLRHGILDGIFDVDPTAVP